MHLLIYGSKEFAQTVTDLLHDCGHQAAGLVDDYATGPGIVGTFDTAIRRYPPSEFGFAVAIGYSNLPARRKVGQRIHAAGYRMLALVHPRAYVADTAHLGQGSMVMAGAIVDTRATIGELGVVWPGACINHDSIIGENTFVSPNAIVCGCSRIGADSFIGAGAAIRDHCELPAGSFVPMLQRYTGGRQ